MTFVSRQKNERLLNQELLKESIEIKKHKRKFSNLDIRRFTLPLLELAEIGSPESSFLLSESTAVNSLLRFSDAETDSKFEQVESMADLLGNANGRESSFQKSSRFDAEDSEFESIAIKFPLSLKFSSESMRENCV